jgi:hypothetical protein
LRAHWIPAGVYPRVHRGRNEWKFVTAYSIAKDERRRYETWPA